MTVYSVNQLYLIFNTSFREYFKFLMTHLITQILKRYEDQCVLSNINMNVIDLTLLQKLFSPARKFIYIITSGYIKINLINY